MGDDEGPPPRVVAGRARGTVLMLVLVVGVGKPAFLGWGSTRIGQVEGQPRVWADREHVAVTRVDGSCLKDRGRGADQTICPATWSSRGDDADDPPTEGWVGDGHGSTVPDVGGTVTARVTEVEQVDGEPRVIVLTTFDGSLATFQRHPWALPMGWLVFLSPLIGVLVKILVDTRPHSTRRRPPGAR